MAQTFFDLGTGPLSWSIAAGQVGYFYGSGPPVATFARISSDAPCSNDGLVSGYAGFGAVQEVSDASLLSYREAVPPLEFGTRQSDCNAGLLAFRQGNRYGIIDFLSIDGVDLDGVLTLRYWVADAGETDFSRAE